MDNNGHSLLVLDYLEGEIPAAPSKSNTQPLPELFGRNLDTLEKARQWLTNPHNWHTGELFVLRWNGLIPTVSQRHGERLIKEPWDDGLPWCVVYEQRRRRDRGEKGESMEAGETLPQEPSEE